MHYRRKMSSVREARCIEMEVWGPDPTFAPSSAIVLLGFSTADSKPQVHLALLVLVWIN